MWVWLTRQFHGPLKCADPSVLHAFLPTGRKAFSVCPSPFSLPAVQTSAAVGCGELEGLFGGNFSMHFFTMWVNGATTLVRSVRFGVFSPLFVWVQYKQIKWLCKNLIICNCNVFLGEAVHCLTRAGAIGLLSGTVLNIVFLSCMCRCDFLLSWSLSSPSTLFFLSLILFFC